MALWLALLLASTFGCSPVAPSTIRSSTDSYPEAGGVYVGNQTLYFVASPYKVTRTIFVQAGANLTIEQGVKLYFAPGTGIVVQGVIHAVGNHFLRIHLLPAITPEQNEHEQEFPVFRLVDGPSTSQGRLQVFYKSKYRSVCTRNTNWTEADFVVACRSMGFGGGNFWRWFRRQNDTAPFVLSKPGCSVSDTHLRSCANWTDERIALAENLCQGEDDIGIVCWGPPTFLGHEYHWMGIDFQDSPWQYVTETTGISQIKESKSRLEHVDILYAGYDGRILNATAAITIRGTPPFMNYLNVIHSAGDGIRITSCDSPVQLTNSTVSYNRGHGFVIDRTSDGRVFINETRIERNNGDGIRYLPHLALTYRPVIEDVAGQDSVAYYEPEKPEGDICSQRNFDGQSRPFPRTFSASLINGTSLVSDPESLVCYATLDFGHKLPYTYTVQFLEMTNRNQPIWDTTTFLVICDTFAQGSCRSPRYRIPVMHERMPQSVEIRNLAGMVLIGLQHEDPEETVRGDVRVVMKMFAGTEEQVMHGLNVSNSKVSYNNGRGIFLQNVRDRTVINNVTILHNRYTAGIHVLGGVGDIWINNSVISGNLGDGINISYAGGSTVVNGTTISNNEMRGLALHQNGEGNFLAIKQELVVKGRPPLNNDFTPTLIQGNFWGGILVGNFCVEQGGVSFPRFEPRVIVNYVELIGNMYHPSFEYHSCQRRNQPLTRVDFSGSICKQSSGFCFRVEPAVNVRLDVNNNRFVENQAPAMLIYNNGHPQLSDLPATVSITRNHMKFNTGPFIVSVGLNEGSPVQNLTFELQNEIRDNTVINPFPLLSPRSQPYAAMIVSSSNSKVRRNCFNNPKADYEVATNLDRHSAVISAAENNWGSSEPRVFMYKIFDQFKRYTLARIDVDPFAAVCNSQNPRLTPLLTFIRQFRKPSAPFVLGGMIYENTDLDAGEYEVVDDLHVVSGAVLSLKPGVTLRFHNGIGMLVQGQLLRSDYDSSQQPIVMTSAQSDLTVSRNIRLISDTGDPYSGRLEVKVNNNMWGTVCNRSWTVQLATVACAQLGMVINPEFVEAWTVHPPAGELPMVMDNIRCEEREYDITTCRHDGLEVNIKSYCPPTDVVGLRCVQPKWAGVRYTILANPPSITGEKTICNVRIDSAGILDFMPPTFMAALQIDWNYHLFEQLTVEDNFYNGMEIIYNDLLKKPKVLDSAFVRNGNHGVKIRSMGLTMQNVTVNDNAVAGVRYNPLLSAKTQQDVYSWLESDSFAAGNVEAIPSRQLQSLVVSSFARDQRKFLIAKTNLCPTNCTYHLTIRAESIMPNYPSSRIGIQVVNRPLESSDEDIVFEYDAENGHSAISLRHDLIMFPFVSRSNQIHMTYRKSYGDAAAIIMVFHLGHFEYIDRFVHILSSSIKGNQYGLASVHYSNVHYPDGSIAQRQVTEQIWLQKTNLSQSQQSVLWVNSYGGDYDSAPAASLDLPYSSVNYFIDNCSITSNPGSLVETRREPHRSANVFSWKIFRSTFNFNDLGLALINLPYPLNVTAADGVTQKVEVTETNFEENQNFALVITGYYAWLNISSNNFTRNRSAGNGGVIRIAGTEKEMIMERNRFQYNRARYVLHYDIRSQTLTPHPHQSRVFYNYVLDNYFLTPEDPYVQSWPRSYAVGMFGLQFIDVSFNNFRNSLFDFEMVVGVNAMSINDSANITYNYWGRDTVSAVRQRIFDFDDWNIFALAECNPYMVTEERTINWEWTVRDAQLSYVTPEEPNIYDLHGRLFRSVTLARQREKWPDFPYYYKPDRVYIIRKDLTVMPGATLTIEKGVEVHIYPNVRILVLGSFIADGTFFDPIRLKPVNMTDIIWDQQKGRLQVRRSVASEGGDSAPAGTYLIRRNFSLLTRDNSFYQLFSSHLVDGRDARSGFLEIYNVTTGDMVPVCDRHFTVRNAEVVCREIGRPTRNAYFWIGPRWNYDPRVRLIRSFSLPRQCIGDEPRLADCIVRLSNDRGVWTCSDAEHFVFVHCGSDRGLNSDYVGHWGGIMFATPFDEVLRKPTSNVLRHVEVVGAGLAHNDCSDSIAVVQQSVVLESVNVTNSSMHGITIVGARDQVHLTGLNVTFNRGVGLNILMLNPSVASSGYDEPLKKVLLPYHMAGVLDLCSSGKELVIEERLLIYYKYDGYPVECVKFITSKNPAKTVKLKLLQFNLFNSTGSTFEDDSLTLFDGKTLNNENVLGVFSYKTSRKSLSRVIASSGATLGIYLRASAADSTYSFIAEAVVVPSPPLRRSVRVAFIKDALVAYNDRGAMSYSSAGDVNPDLEATFCSFNYNGYNVHGNFSTCSAAVELDLYNTRNLLLQNCMFFKNQGGLQMTVASGTPSGRLEGIVRNCAFGSNANFETFRLVGSGYQKAYVANNYFGFNEAPYRDVVLIDKVLTNFTHNVLCNNTGTHIVDMSGYEDESAEYQTFYNNFVYDNVATGHGYQFPETYGFFGTAKIDSFLIGRSRRQVAFEPGPGLAPAKRLASFEWWADVGLQSERYRSTLFAGSAKQQYSMNYFQNPANNFELTTAVDKRSEVYDGSIDAKNNYWGYPGTAAVASAKLRDGHDYRYLIDVSYMPVLESNTTLLDGSCPPGWFQVGFEEWKLFRSCFLFVPGAAMYRTAQEFCKSQNAYLPYFRDQDRRLTKLTEKIDQQLKRFTSPLERFTVSHMYEARIWISSVNVPPEKCGYLSSKTGLIGIYNCEGMLPFVCEKGPKPFTEPIYWQPAGIAVFVVSFLLMLLIMLLGALWYVKSKRRKKEFFERKSSLRSSIRSLRLAQALEHQQQQQLQKSIMAQQQQPSSLKPRSSSPDLVEQAHRNLVLGARSTESLTNTRISKSIERPTSVPFITVVPKAVSTTNHRATPASSDRHSDASRSPTSSYCGSDVSKNDKPSPSTASNGSSFTSVSRSVLSYREPKIGGTSTFGKSSVDTSRYVTTIRYDDPTLVTFRGGRRSREDTTTASQSSYTCTSCRTSSTGYDPSCSECRRNSRRLLRNSHYTSEETLTVNGNNPEEVVCSSRTTSTTLANSDSNETMNAVRDSVVDFDAEGPFLPNGQVRWPGSATTSNSDRTDTELFRRTGSRKPVYYTGKSTPNLRDSGEEQSATSLLGGSMVPPVSVRSMNYLPSWTPPNLDSFNRSNDSDLVRPLETAM